MLVAALVITGAGCIRPTVSTSENQPPLIPPLDGGEISREDTENPDWIRYSASQAGQIGMSFLYPPNLTPVKWDTQAWGDDAVGVDFTGFGIARIPNLDRLTIEQWIAAQYPDFAFDFSPVGRTEVFADAVPTGACEVYIVTDDFEESAGLSGIGSTMFVNVGDASLYAFTLGQDWDQTLGDLEKTIKKIMKTIEWFAEQTACPQTMNVLDDRVGIAFDIPSSFAPIVIQDEFGLGMEAGETGPLDCLTNRIFLSRGEQSDAVLLTVNDTWECEVPGRDGYWGDQARQFVSEQAIADWCAAKDSCDSFVNKNGVTVWHAFTSSAEEWGTTVENVHEYAAWNPNRSVHGILFSNQSFLQASLDLPEAALRAIVESLTFIE